MNATEIISHNIKLLREIDGTTQGEFGEKYGSNQKSIWAYEKGNVAPKSKFILALSKGVGISEDVLLTVKLKRDRTGNITNIPKADSEILRIRNELQSMINDYKKATDTFFSSLIALNKRLDKLERDTLNKKLNK
jgi:transcriptional regulator with XRE-family HTH domain